MTIGNRSMKKRRRLELTKLPQYEIHTQQGFRKFPLIRISKRLCPLLYYSDYAWSETDMSSEKLVR